jgi:hypothetical protein
VNTKQSFRLLLTSKMLNVIPPSTQFKSYRFSEPRFTSSSLGGNNLSEPSPDTEKSKRGTANHGSQTAKRQKLKILARCTNLSFRARLKAVNTEMEEIEGWQRRTLLYFATMKRDMPFLNRARLNVLKRLSFKTTIFHIQVSNV